MAGQPKPVVAEREKEKWFSKSVSDKRICTKQGDQTSLGKTRSSPFFAKIITHFFPRNK
jgi:hypothetical protein